MPKIEYLELPSEKGQRFFLQRESLIPIYEELEGFLATDHNMDNLHFAKKMLFSYEIKANNQVEGYGDDLSVIEDVIKKNTDRIENEYIKMRISNLYRGYQYILNHQEVDKEHLKELYEILSKDLLGERDKTHMGEYYRQGKVYILQGGRIDQELDEGVDYTKIDELMETYFYFFNALNFPDNITDQYIKSQILHFYFVYIHPYFDVNGRTSRTLALWYLLKNKAYPYIIFNRGISFAGSNYDRIIKRAKLSRNITGFLRFMLETVSQELEKESIMQAIASNTPYKLNGVDYQTLLYFLTMNGNKTVKDFVHFYNRFNSKKKGGDIYENMLLPLIDEDILKVVRSTKNYLGQMPNMVLELNEKLIPEENSRQLKRLKRN